MDICNLLEDRIDMSVYSQTCVCPLVTIVTVNVSVVLISMLRLISSILVVAQCIQERIDG